MHRLLLIIDQDKPLAVISKKERGWAAFLPRMQNQINTDLVINNLRERKAVADFPQRSIAFFKRQEWWKIDSTKS